MHVLQLILITLGIICFVAALWLLFKREMIAPAASLLGLTAIYFSHILPLAPNMVITWLALTVIVMCVCFMQPPEIMAQQRGMGYMLGGALTGLVVGLIAVQTADSLTARYAALIIGVAAGTFFGFLLFTGTPQGKAVNLASGRFFNYLAAKGFPLALTIIQPGIVLMLAMLGN